MINYRTGKHMQAPKQLDDLAACISYVMKHAKELNIEKEDYAIAGFSAGGHLAASFGRKEIGYGRYHLPKPKMLFLAYPVITLGEYTHHGSRHYLLGKRYEKDAACIEKYSVEKHITEHYPSCYVWQCEADDTVPSENSKMLVKQLEQYGVNHIFKLFPGTKHGIGIGRETSADGWLDEAIAFWETTI